MAFYMNMMALNEGEQAEEYKKRKQEEKDENNAKDRSRILRRSMTSGTGYKNPKCSKDDPYGVLGDDMGTTKQEEINYIRSYAANDKAYKANGFDDKTDAILHKEKELRAKSNDLHNAKDAADRHMRRHPDQYDKHYNYIGVKKEMGIFSECYFLEYSANDVADHLKKQRQSFMDDHNERMKDVRAAMDSLKKVQQNNIDNDKIKEDLDQISKDLDDLLK